MYMPHVATCQERAKEGFTITYVLNCRISPIRWEKNVMQNFSKWTLNRRSHRLSTTHWVLRCTIKNWWILLEKIRNIRATIQDIELQCVASQLSTVDLHVDRLPSKAHSVQERPSYTAGNSVASVAGSVTSGTSSSVATNTFRRRGLMHVHEHNNNYIPIKLKHFLNF